MIFENEIRVPDIIFSLVFLLPFRELHVTKLSPLYTFP